jgi:hypothetical protein
VALRRLLTYENALVVVLELGGAVAALDAQALFYLSPFLANSRVEFPGSSGDMKIVNSTALGEGNVQANERRKGPKSLSIH